MSIPTATAVTAASQGTNVRRARLALLLALGWIAFIPAVFWGLFFAPALALRADLDVPRVLAAGESWWRSHAPQGRAGVVLLPAQECRCGGGRDGLAGGVPSSLIRLAADAELAVAVHDALPPGARLDTLVFDAAGRLRLAFDRHDAAHCIDARRMLAGGVPQLPQPLLWPGVCACPEPPLPLSATGA